jgi:hypothetical protein
MKRAPSAVFRVNSAGVLAKLGSASLIDDVIRTLKSDVDTRRLYLTAVASRVLQLPWSDAAAFSANVERGHAWQGEDPARVRHCDDFMTAASQDRLIWESGRAKRADEH